MKKKMVLTSAEVINFVGVACSTRRPQLLTPLIERLESPFDDMAKALQEMIARVDQLEQESREARGKLSEAEDVLARVKEIVNELGTP